MAHLVLLIPPGSNERCQHVPHSTHSTFMDGFDFLLTQSRRVQFTRKTAILPSQTQYPFQFMWQVINATSMNEVIEQELGYLENSSGDLSENSGVDVGWLLSVRRLSLLASNANQKSDQPSNLESDET
jgi:hypothetical protein